MAATMPAGYGNNTVEEEDILADSELDAEGEDDVDIYPPPMTPGNFGGSESIDADHELDEEVEVSPLDVTAEQIGQGAEVVASNGPGREQSIEVEQRPATAKQLAMAYKSESDVEEADPSFTNEANESIRDVASHHSSDDDSEVDEDWEAESDDRDSADEGEQTQNFCM